MSDRDPGSEPRAPTAEGIGTRAELAAALTALRLRAGLSVRDVVTASGALHGTVAGWFAGQHLPTKASGRTFRAVLRACGVTEPDALDEWEAAVARARRTPGHRTTGAPPYRGLEPFGVEDAEWFFGREYLVDELCARVVRAVSGDGPRTVLVTGPSGSGKSSLVCAGLVPRIGRPGTLLADRTAVLVTPGPDPATALDGIGPTGRSVVVVDRVEELFTVATADERRRFLDRLAAAPAVVAVIRSDFLDRAAAEPLLGAGLAAGPVLVGPLTAERLRAAIVEPARRAGRGVDDDLVRLLGDELAPRGGSHTGELPLLSHALLGTWSRADGRSLSVADYYATGGIAGAVQQSAEEAFTALTPSQQAVAKRILLRLVNVDGDIVTRRRADRRELFVGRPDPGGPDDGRAGATAPGGAAAVEAVLDEFTRRRLLTVGDETVEVSHEALLTAWPRLRRWIDENRPVLVARRNLRHAVATWQEYGEDDTTLLSGTRLGLVQEWMHHERERGVPTDLTADEQRFVDRSVDHERRQVREERRRVRTLRTLVGLLGVVSVLALVAASVALVSRGNAQDARNDALSRQVATEAVAVRGKDPALAAQLALAAYRISPTVDARSALLDATATHSPVRILGPAGSTKVRTGHCGLVAAVGSDGAVRLWDAGRVGTDQTPRGRIAASDAGRPQYALAVSSDSALLASGGDGGATLWDIRDRAAPRRLGHLPTTPDTVIESLAFTPDARWLVAGTLDGLLLRFDLADPRRPVAARAIDDPGAGRLIVAMSPDGRVLATTGRERTVRLWDATRMAALDAPLYEAGPDGTSHHALGAAFSPDGRILAIGTSGREVVRFDVTDPRRPRALPSLTGFESYVNDVAFSADGTLVAAGGSDSTVRVWRTDDDFPVESMPGPAIVTSVTFDETGAVVTGSVDGATRYWSMPGPVLARARDSVFVTPVSEDGRTVLAGAGARDGALHLWDLSDPHAARELPDLHRLGDDRFSGAAALSRSGDRAAGGTGDGALYLWDISDRARPVLTAGRIPAVEGIVGALAFSPDAALVAVAGQDGGPVGLFDVTDPTHPRRTASVPVDRAALGLAFSPDGRFLAAATAGTVVEIVDVSDPAAPRPVSSLSGFETFVQAVAFSPDGRVLTAGSADQSVRLWDVSDPRTPRVLAHLTELSGPVYSLGFDPRGTALVAALGSGEVALWDVTDPADPLERAVLRAYPDRVFDARFAGDTDVVVGAGPDSAVRMWSTDPDTAARQICAGAGTPLSDREWRRYLLGVPPFPLCER